MVDENVKIIKLSQASSLAKIISNNTAQQIIELIGKSKKATASQISKKLNIPASTVHYNIKALVKGGIVDDAQFTYSQKGKTIIHYTLTNNILVIIPESRDEFSVLKSIKALVPSILGIGIIGAMYSFFSKSSTIASNSAMKNSLAKLSLDESARAVPAAVMFESNTADVGVQAADIAIKTTNATIQSPSVVPHLEFICGLIIATITLVGIFIIRNYIISRKNKKNKQ